MRSDNIYQSAYNTTCGLKTGRNVPEEAGNRMNDASTLSVLTPVTTRRGV